MSGKDGAVIRGQSLERVYQQGTVSVPALQKVDIEIKRGEFTTLAGSSGSGKTTLLNLMGCLDRPTKGQIFLEGQDMGRFSRADAAEFRLRNIGFVFQAYNLMPVLSAYENAELSLLYQGVPKEKRRELVMPLLERVGLGGMESRRPGELSGGQQQRVAVVRAIAARPRIVLGDEPTANLDYATSVALIELMLELNREHEITFVLASHDPEVMERSRRVVRMKDGKVIDDQARA